MDVLGEFYELLWFYSFLFYYWVNVRGEIMSFFDKDKYNRALFSYYCSCFGKQETDVWYEQPAVNVWVFGRGNEIITLHSHIITGEVTARVERKKENKQTVE